MPFAIVLVVLAIVSWFSGRAIAAGLLYLGVSPLVVFALGIIAICWSIFGRTDSDWS